MNFLIPNDYLPYIKSDNLTQIHQNNPDLLDELEKVAIQKIIQYTGNLFDSSCLFPVINTYDSNTSYALGDYVVENNVIYVAEAAVAAPHTIGQFKQDDPRNQLIKQWVTDCVLYDLHSRIAPNQIPRLRVERYVDCMKMLKELANGLYSGLPSACRLTDSDDNTIVNWGSDRKIDQSW